MADTFDGAFLYCKTGLNYSSLAVLNFNVTDCQRAVAALRLIKPGFSVQGVIGLSDCPVAQKINAMPQRFYGSVLQHVQTMSVDGIQLDWEACPFCDSTPLSGGNNCTPAGFGQKFGEMALGLAKLLRSQRKTLSLAITVADQANAFNGKMDEFIYAHDLIAALRGATLVERVTDMDTYTNSYAPSAKRSPSYFEKAATALVGAWGRPLLGVGMAAYESPKQRDADQVIHGLRTLEQLGVKELDVFDVDAGKGIPPAWWLPLLQRWKNGSLAS
jgi:hypothetical protein